MSWQLRAEPRSKQAGLKMKEEVRAKDIQKVVDRA
jgi:hypothetical protein